MIAIGLLVSNAEEVAESKKNVERLGMGEIVQPISVEREICFPINSMMFAFLNDKGDIKTIISGQEVILKFDKKVYDRIKEHFKYI